MAVRHGAETAGAWERASDRPCEGQRADEGRSMKGHGGGRPDNGNWEIGVEDQRERRLLEMRHADEGVPDAEWMAEKRREGMKCIPRSVRRTG